ncbi:MAG: DUF262 domain-containing protein [Muribaculaceae bacterium]|nr:DUF262 domain-containing protein [Muribaculaceae bacterium]
MQANYLSIPSIFDRYTLHKVPFYQRSYVWEEDKWSRFLEDMCFVSETQKSYFLGTIILKFAQASSGSSKECTIIDGQQRLTTIILFFKSLSLKKAEFMSKFNDDFFLRGVQRQVALLHSMNDIADFTEVMSLTEDKPIEREKPTKIIQAYNFFQSNIDISKIDYDSVLGNLSMIVINLNDGEDEQAIFDTINSLSEPLTTGELLKNYFFKKETREEYEETWLPVFEADTETVDFWNQIVTQGRQFKTNIDAFFNAMIQIKIHNKSIPGITSEYKLRIKRNERLFHNFKALISDFDLDKKELVNEIIDYAILYKDNLSIDVNKIVLSGSPSIERINFMIEYFDCSTLVPYILYILKNVEEETERNRIYEVLESYITRRVIAKSSNKNYSDLFAENLIGGNILTAQRLKEYLMSKDDEQSLAMPTNAAINEAVRENEQNNKRSLAILYMLESRLREGNPHSTSLLNYDAYSLEHIMPKKWVANWQLISEYDERKRDHYIKTLGNHSLLNARLNTAISNADWHTKLNGNSKGKGFREHAVGLETINTILGLNKWDELEILNRADWLADKINQVWESHENEELVLTSHNSNTRRNKPVFSLNGGSFVSMSSFVPYFVKKYVEDNPSLTYAQLKKIFNDDLCATGFKFRGFLCNEDVYNAWESELKDKRYQPSKPGRRLVSSDGVIFFVNTQWTYDSFKRIIALAESFGYTVDEQ